MRKNCKIDGINISYIEEGSGKPIVMLHGWGRDASDFTTLIDFLPNSYRKIAVDLPGHGQSDEPIGDLSLDGINQVILNMFSALGIEDPILICHSYGARLAIKLAYNKEITNKIVITGGAGIEIKDMNYKIKVAHYKFMKFLASTIFYKQYKRDLIAGSGSVDYRNASDTMKGVMSKAVTEDLSDLLSYIDNQVLLYWGEADEATPLWHGEMMHRAMKNSYFVSYPNLTHFAFLENYADFNSYVNKFIGGEL